MSSNKSNPNHRVIIYTDGSCIGNPGPGGYAALIILENLETQQKKEIQITGNQPDTTNNRMEMRAIIEALKWLHEKFPPKKLQSLSIYLYSDSNLIIQTLTKNWKRKANTDLWAKIDKLRTPININWNWVKAHSTNEYNNFVDQLAQNEARKI